MGNKVFRLQRIKQQLKRFVALPFLFISLALFVFSSTSNNISLVEIKKSSYTFFMPIISFVSSPIKWMKENVSSIKNYVNVYEENKKLRAENKLLKGWQNTAIKLSMEQKELFSFLNYKPLSSEKSFLVRVLGEYNSPFVHSFVLQAGKNEGVAKGDVLFFNNSLVGHVIEVQDSFSRALRLTDYYSRLPVYVGENKVLCVMVGNNTDYPELVALPEEVQLNEGDFVMTAGFAGVYPTGIAIGYVKKDGAGYKVQLIENKTNIEFVNVVQFNIGGLIDTNSSDKED